MKRNLFFIAFTALIVTGIVFSFVSTSESRGSGQFKYIGVQKCVMCHKTDAQGKQLDIWKGSAHANAYKTLEKPEADEIAKQKGFSTKAVETPACIKCHVLGKDIDQTELSETFDIKDGVQCESCHGPGSEYKAMSIMKDKQKAIENGLFVPDSKEKFCTQCHNSESPTYKEFNFDTFWEKIKHKKP